MVVEVITSGYRFTVAGDDGEAYLDAATGAWYAYEDVEEVGDG